MTGTVDYPHLDERIRALMSEPTPVRIAACRQDRWIKYQRAADILDALEALVVHPRSMRMPNVLVAGRSGNGKSSIINRFVKLHPPTQSPTGGPVVTVLRAEVPGSPDESALWSAMLTALLVTHNPKERAPLKFIQLKTMLRTLGTRVLVLDEFNNVIRAGKRAGDLLAQLKNLSNELMLSIAAFGTPDAANALTLEPQMKSRFQPHALDKWECTKEYATFLATYEKLLPLAKPSNLSSTDMAKGLHLMGGDTIGGTVNVLKEAAVLAIESGEERITRRVLARLSTRAPDAWQQIAVRT